MVTRTARAIGDDLDLVAPPVPPRFRSLLYRWAGVVELGSGIVRRELPFIGAPVILTFGSPYLLSDAATPGVADQSIGQFAAGLQRTYSSTQSTGPSWSMQMDFTPLGARTIFAQPMAELTDRVVAVDTVIGRDAHQLIRDLEATTTWIARFSLLESFLGGRLAIGPPPDPAIAWALSRLTDASPRDDIAFLADRLGWSHRHLIARFRDDVGMSPMRVYRQARFIDAVQRIRRASPGTSLASIAADAGFSDQSHLNRSFREFAGLTPSAFRVGEDHPDRVLVNFVQDAGSFHP